MITLIVHAHSGHYKIAGQVGMGRIACSHPIAPISTMRGFLESLMGEGNGSFEGEFAYGFLHEPGGHGMLYRKSQVWVSDGTPGSVKALFRDPEGNIHYQRKVVVESKGKPRNTWVDLDGIPTEEDGEVRIKTLAGANSESIRPFHIETFFDLTYIVLIKGPQAAKIREAIAGNVERFGVLYLGTSDDAVTWVGEYEGSLEAVQWVVPGTTIPLTITAPYGYGNYSAEYGSFDLNIGEPHFFGAP